MTEPFDPYYDWLGISPDEQPADHYRLLGVKRFESNAAAISNAADQRVRHLRSVQTGKRMAESQKLLNEVATASTCLLSAERKQAYDEQLRQQIAASNPLPKPTPVAKPLVAQPLPSPVPVRAHESGIGLPVAKAFEAPVLGAPPLVAVDRARSMSRKPATSNAMILLGIAGLAMVLMLGTAVGLVIWGFASQDLAINPLPPDGRNNLPHLAPVPPVGPPAHGVTPITPTLPNTSPQSVSPRPASPGIGSTAISTTGTTGNPTGGFPALELTTGSSLDIFGAGSAIEFDRPFTVEAWLQLAPTGNPQITWETPGRGRLFEGVQASGNLSGKFMLGYGVNGSTNFTSTNAKPEEWHHWAVSSDGTDLRMFMNGRVVSTTKPRMPAGPGLPPGGGPPLRLRAQQSGPPQVMALVRDARVSSVGRYTAAFEPPATLDVDSHTLARPDLTRSSNGALTDAAGKVQTLRLVNGARLVTVGDAGQTVSTASNDSPSPAGKLDLNVEVGPAVDLLKDVPRVLVGGDVRLERGKLITGGAGGDKMQFEHTPPSDYLVAAEFTREKGNEVFALQIVVEGRPCAVLIDSFADQGYYSGLEKIENQRVNASGHPANTRGPQLQNGKLARLRCLVVKNHVVVELDNKILVNWQGDPATLSRDGILAISHSSRLGIFTWDSSYSIDGLRVYPITKHNLGGANSVASATPPRVTPPVRSGVGTYSFNGGLRVHVANSVNLLQDVEIKKHSGDYTTQGSFLLTRPETACRLEFSHEPPQDYMLDAFVTRQSGQGSLAINLLVEGRPCTLNIDGFFDVGFRTGLEMIGGQRLPETPSAVQGQQLPPGQTFNLRVIVLKNRVILYKTGNRIYEWSGDTSQLEPPADVKFGNGKSLGLVTWESAFSIPRLTLHTVVGHSQSTLQSGPPSTSSPGTSSGASTPPVASMRVNNLDLRLGPPVELMRDARPRMTSGGMSTSDTHLSTTESNQCRMEFPYDLPAEYVFHAAITRQSNNDLIAWNIVVDGHPCAIVIDGSFNGQSTPLSGLETIDGKRVDENLTAVRAQVLETQKPADLKIAVVKNRVVAEVNGRTLVDWRGDASRLSTFYKIGSGKTIGLTTQQTSYRVEQPRVYPITSSSIAREVASGTSAAAPAGPLGFGRPKEKVPDDAAQQKSKQRMSEALGESIAKAGKAEDKLKLAKQFVDVAATGEDTATRYVLLEAARKMAVTAQDFDYSLSLVDHLARDFEVDALALKLQTLQQAAATPALPIGRHERLATLAETLTREAEEGDRMDVVEPASKVAFDSANKARNLEQRKAIKALRDRIVLEKQEWDKAQAAIEDLKASPDDPEKNLLVGKFYTSLREDWSRALPHLAKASDQAWAAAAKAELAANDSEAKYAAAEGWFALSGSAGAADKPAVQSHALELLQSVAPQLAGLSKVKADKRIADLQALAAAAEKADPEKAAGRRKKVGKTAYEPGLIARAFRSQPFDRPTHVLGIVTNSDDYQAAANDVIRRTLGNYGSDYFQMVAIGYVILDQDEAVKFALDNCVCMLDGNQISGGLGPKTLEMKLKRGRHPIMLYRSEQGSPGPQFHITTVDSRKNPLFYSTQDLQVEMAKLIRDTSANRTTTGQLLFGIPNP